MKKLVEREHLVHLESELFYIKLTAHSDLQERIDELISYVNENIIQKDKDFINETKRVIYKRMKEAPTEEENKRWYALYNELKNQGDQEVED